MDCGRYRHRNGQRSASARGVRSSDAAARTSDSDARSNVRRDAAYRGARAGNCDPGSSLCRDEPDGLRHGHHELRLAADGERVRGRQELRLTGPEHFGVRAPVATTAAIALTAARTIAPATCARSLLRHAGTHGSSTDAARGTWTGISESLDTHSGHARRTSNPDSPAGDRIRPLTSLCVGRYRLLHAVPRPDTGRGAWCMTNRSEPRSNPSVAVPGDALAAAASSRIAAARAASKAVIAAPRARIGPTARQSRRTGTSGSLTGRPARRATAA